MIKHLFLFLLSTFLTTRLLAQITFEEIPLNASGYYNGSDQAGGFATHNLFFSNQYDPQFQAWSGFAASSLTDTATAGFGNQYSCFAGMGAGGSQKFALAYVYTRPVVHNYFIDGSPKLKSFQYTNSTFAGLSMKNGDAFSKKFGGPSGNDPDFFMLQVYNYRGGVITDSADIYLADYRFADNSQDYIVKQWRTADLNFANPFDSLIFNLKSSDNGAFGMNTPAYFCLDNLETELVLPVKSLYESQISYYPNPTRKQLTLQGLIPGQKVSILNAQGRPVFTITPTSSKQSLEVESLATGLYTLWSEKGIIGRFVKE